jgi:hypothetical protein
LISKNRLPGARKMLVREILGRATFQLRAAQLLSGDDSHLHISRPSRAGAGLQPGGMARPDSERPELWVVRNLEGGPAVFRPRVFPSKNLEGAPHFKAPKQAHRLCRTRAQPAHYVAAAQLSWFPGIGHISIVGRPRRSCLLSAAGPSIFSQSFRFLGGVQSSANCGPLSSCPLPNLPCKLPGYAGPVTSVSSLLKSPSH